MLNLGDHSKTSAELVFHFNLSENARRRIGLLGQVPPTPPLIFVSQSKQKAKVGMRLLSENHLRPKSGEGSMPTRSDYPSALQEFSASLSARDPKTVMTYLTTLRDFVAWLTIQVHPKIWGTLLVCCS